MNRRQIALKLVLAELGLPATMDSFDDRLILQKSIYLTQQSGIPLGYHYYWYLRGPYSRDLTADAFATLSDAPEGWELDEGSRKTLSKLKMFFDELRKATSPVKAFELLASVLFTVVTGQAKADDGERITQLMIAAGKHFNLEEVNGAVKSLRENGFLPHV